MRAGRKDVDPARVNKADQALLDAQATYDSWVSGRMHGFGSGGNGGGLRRK